MTGMSSHPLRSSTRSDKFLSYLHGGDQTEPKINEILRQQSYRAYAGYICGYTSPHRLDSQECGSNVAIKFHWIL